MKTRTTGLLLIGVLFLAAPAVDAQMEMGAMGSRDMSPMQSEHSMWAMYRPGEVDGCTDFHCLDCPQCSDRNACSRGSSCNMPNCGHKHGAVMCHGGVLFYLRESDGATDEHGSLSCVARAKQVAARLNSFMGMMESHENCYFTIRDAHKSELKSNSQTPTIWFCMNMSGDKKMQKVVTVTPGDLNGYKYRADLPELQSEAMPASKLTAKLVAQWWAANLKDHFRMMVLSKEPHLTTYTPCGEVLIKIWKQAREKAPQGPIPMPIWNEVIENLPSEDKTNLLLAAQIVPKEFDPER